MQLVLASSSKSRLKLLDQISLKPDQIYPTNIDETPKKTELPARLATRLAREKSLDAAKNFNDAFIISADTVSACGRRILNKALSNDQVRDSLNILSGRRHQIYTSICISKIEKGNIIKSSDRLVKTIIKFKKLTAYEIDEYVSIGEGIGSSSGYTIDGIAESYIIWMSGSYSNVVGLPLYETKCLLYGIGYKR